MSKDKVFHFNIFSFIIAFAIGIMYVFVNSPKPKYIIKYPTPYNIERNVYKGLDDQCYKFKIKEVNCSAKYIEQPII